MVSPILGDVSGDVAALIPVKPFATGKSRLDPALDPNERAALAEKLATAVIHALDPIPTFVACEDDSIAAWASSHGSTPLQSSESGLNRVVRNGVAALAKQGYARVMVVHADVADPRNLPRLVEWDGVVLVPDREFGGTNVLIVPAAAGFHFSYGPGSFARHLSEAERTGLPTHIIEDSWTRARPRRASGPRCLRRGPRQRCESANPAGTMTTQGEPNPITTDLDTPDRALAIAAHPDDIEFGSGATLAKWAARGCEVSLLICTDGSKGTWDANADTDRLVVVRQDEQRAAAAELGATGEVVFLGWTDGELDSGCANVRRWRR